MKIIRDGKEFELTREELFNAYAEQRWLFAVENIEMNMENYLEDDEYEILKDNREFIEDAAHELIRNEDKYNMDYSEALKDAIEDTKDKYLEAE